jgi:hypothetical protein
MRVVVMITSGHQCLGLSSSYTREIFCLVAKIIVYGEQIRSIMEIVMKSMVEFVGAVATIAAAEAAEGADTGHLSLVRIS